MKKKEINFKNFDKRVQLTEERNQAIGEMYEAIPFIKDFMTDGFLALRESHDPIQWYRDLNNEYGGYVSGSLAYLEKLDSKIIEIDKKISELDEKVEKGSKKN